MLQIKIATTITSSFQNMYNVNVIVSEDEAYGNVLEDKAFTIITWCYTRQEKWEGALTSTLL